MRRDPLRIAIVTTGCKVNRTDSEAIQSALSTYPVSWVGVDDKPDLVIVNACTVTRAADRDGRAAVNRGLRTGASVFVAGCMATRLADGNTDNDNAPVDKRAIIVPGTADRKALIDACVNFIEKQMVQPDEDDAFEAKSPIPTKPDRRARPTIKVQDGCDWRCSYCIVPHVRGPSKSSPLADVIRQIEVKTRDLTREAPFAGEIVLTGIDLGAWGRDIGDQTLADLVSQLLTSYEHPRFRLSSIEPHGLSHKLVELLSSSPRVCRHVHVPLQSGSDAILLAMNRPYDSTEFIRRVREITDTVNDITLGMDVIVGYPGETNDDFQDTLRVVSMLPTTYLHVFTFSTRPGTSAVDAGPVPPPEKTRERGRLLRKLSADRRRLHAANLVGQVIEVVDVRTAADGSFIEALASDYTRVKIMGEQTFRPERSLVRIVSSEEATALGERVR